MTPREERGLVIAATQRLTQKGKVWLVPSQTGNGTKYTVHPDSETPFCSCPDFEETGCKCKHLFAVETVMKREMAKDGTVTETRSVTFTQKKTYKQPEWGVYNLAQTEEKRRFLALLHDLCHDLPEPTPAKTGRPRTAIADVVFVSVYKIYSQLSARRFGTDLSDAHERGYLTRKINSMLAWSFLESERLTPVLRELIAVSSRPLRMVESDSPQFGPLVKATRENFKINEVSADKAYLSAENIETVFQLGGTPYIPFKENSTGGKGGLFEKMFHYYSLNREQYLAHYHKRSNAESVFSMVKAKFGDSVRSKADVAMKNETLCKILAHNICCLIMSQCELGIEPIFWGEQTAASETPAETVIDVPAVETPAMPAKATPEPSTNGTPPPVFMACAGA